MGPKLPEAAANLDLAEFSYRGQIELLLSQREGGGRK